MCATSGAEPATGARRLPAGRKAELTAYINERGEVTVAELADRLSVSSDTIRRDLDRLDSDGLIIRTHGGALSLSAMPRPESELDVRRRVQTTAKDTIGKLAAGLVRDGSALMINAGSTTLAAVTYLQEHRDLTIATNNLALPHEIAAGVARDVYLFGGVVRMNAMGTVGPVAFPNSFDLRDVDVQCDLALIGLGAVSVETGFSTSNLAEASMMRQMMDRSSSVAILADSSKFGRRLFAQVAELGRPDYFVTNAAPPDPLRKALDRADVRLVLPE